MKKWLMLCILALYVRPLEAQFSGPSNTRITIRETTKTLPLGLWSIGSLGDSFKIEKNTSATGNFGTTVSVFSGSGATVTIAAPSGAWSLTFPTTNGTSDYALTTNGSGTTTWSPVVSSILGTANQITSTPSAGGIVTLALAGPHNFTTLTSNGVLYGNATGAIQATAQGAANTVLTANAGAPAFSATPTVTSITTTGLTNGRVVLVGTGGLHTDDSDLTFATDTVTATKLGVTTSVAIGTSTMVGALNVVGALTFSGADASYVAPFSLLKNSNFLILFGGTSGVRINDSTNSNSLITIDNTGNIFPVIDNVKSNGGASNRWADVRTVLLTVSGTTTVAGDILPSSTSTRAIGSSSASFASVNSDQFILRNTSGLSDGSMVLRSSEGLSLTMKAGSASDFSLFRPGLAALVMSVPTGTANTNFGGNVSPGTDGANDLGTASFRWRNVYLSSILTIGGTPATTGAIRLSNNDFIYSHNAAGSVDVPVIGINGGNILAISNTTINTDIQGPARFPNIGTTASAANAFFDNAAGNNLVRSTSSLRYKRDIKELNLEEARTILNFHPVSFSSTASVDDPTRRWWGLIAEQVDGVLPTVFTNYTIINNMKVPDGLQYDRMVSPMIRVLQDYDSRLQQLEAQISALGGKVN